MIGSTFYFKLLLLEVWNAYAYCIWPTVVQTSILI